MAEDRIQPIITYQVVYEIFFDFKFTTIRDSWDKFVKESNEYHEMLQKFIAYTQGTTDWHVSTEYLVSVDTDNTMTKEEIVKEITDFLTAYPSIKKKIKDVSITNRTTHTHKEWIGKAIL